MLVAFVAPAVFRLRLRKTEPRYSSAEATEAAQKQQKQHKTKGDGNKPHEGTPSDMKSRRNKKSSFRVICGHRELPK